MSLLREAFRNPGNSFKIGAVVALLPLMVGILLPPYLLIAPVVSNIFFAKYLKTRELKMEFDVSTGFGVFLGKILVTFIAAIPILLLGIAIMTINNTLGIVVMAVLGILFFTVLIPVSTLAFLENDFHSSLAFMFNVFKPSTWNLKLWLLKELKYMLLLIPYGIVIQLMYITVIGIPFGFVIGALLYRNFANEISTNSY